MNNLFKCLVMFAALALIIFCVVQYNQMGIQLHDVKLQLAESMEKWETTAAEKEALQEKLKAIQKELNIAQLEYSQSVEDAEKIRAEIEQYRIEIDSLKQGKGE